MEDSNVKDIPAKETAKKQGSRLSKTNEDQKWKKSSSEKKAKGQKEVIGLSILPQRQDRSHCGLKYC